MFDVEQIVYDLDEKKFVVLKGTFYSEKKKEFYTLWFKEDFQLTNKRMNVTHLVVNADQSKFVPMKFASSVNKKNRLLALHMDYLLRDYESDKDQIEVIKLTFESLHDLMDRGVISPGR